MRSHLLATLAGLTLLMPVGASGQATPPKFGWLAKANVAKATAEAKKWRSDSHLFQITSYIVQDGVAMWNYDFFSPGATGEKCLRVMFGRNGQVGGEPQPCDSGDKLVDFMVDSDKAFETARKAGLTKPTLIVGLMMAPVRGVGDRPVWTLSEGSKKGDKSVDVDGISGEIRGRMTMP